MLRHLMQTQTGRVPPAVAVGAVIVAIATVLHIDSLNERIGLLKQEREELAFLSNDHLATLEREREEHARAADLVEAAIDDLESAADQLMLEVGRFDYENWRDVVPAVASAAYDVESAVETARDSASGLR